VINGSKIWTSYARKADWCFLLARTGPERKQISAFLTPMDTPGIEVVSFPGLVCDGHLNEVFLTDVEVPVAARVGEEGKGWEIVIHALSLERVGIPRYRAGRKVLDIAVAQLKREGRFDDPIIRSRAGRIVARLEAARLLTYVVVDQRAKGSAPTPDGNICRIAAAEAVLELMNFLMDYVPDCLLGGDGILAEFYRANIPSSIAAGTYEIQLNLIAQGALGLPRS
jgi:alkylation response protein AidB-like acyl-CoA dehydrogenase